MKTAEQKIVKLTAPQKGEEEGERADRESPEEV